MAYIIGDFIAASHFNNFITSVNRTFSVGTGNFGYGASVIASVQVDGTVFGADWLALRNAIDDCNVHQGINVSAVASTTALPASDDFGVGEIIFAYSGESGRWNLERNASAIFDNRLTLDPTETLLQLDENVSARSTPWSVQLIHEFTVTFASTGAARLFFNQGGSLAISGRRVGGSSSPQNDSWTEMLDDNSPYFFTASAYYSGATTNLKVRNIATGSAVAYTANDWTIKEKRDAVNTANGSQGEVITFQIEFNDDQVGSSTIWDTVNGSIVSSIDTRSSVGRFVSPTPLFQTITELTAGS
jgi:hypothetical protein